MAYSHKWSSPRIGFEPILFLVYINDLRDGVSSSVLKFCRWHEDLWHKKKSETDVKILQQQLQKISEWSESWQMELNLDKCHAMTIGNKNGRCTSYNLCKQQMGPFKSERDLEVIVQSNLKWEEHVEKCVRKATQILGLISRAYVNKSQ